jgi:ABC-type multidrug transport system ATPase subunit
MWSNQTIVAMDNFRSTPQGYTLSWSNLSYTVNSGGAKKQILSNLHGILQPGTVTAVLGASGAGKSSFLDALAGRVPSSLLSGQVAINGSTDIPIRHASRYCTQEEALFTTLTVYETLMYAAHFNLPSSTPLSVKKNVVDKLLLEFGLDRNKDTIIGGPLMKGCSGGQIRRVSVASQVVGLKSGILFLGEYNLFSSFF